MNNLLIFFAIPVAVIIFSIALQKILRCPILVSAIIFAIFLVIAFAISNLTFLIAAIAYGLLAYLTAWLTCIIKTIYRRFSNTSIANEISQCSNCNNNVATQADVDNIISAINNINSDGNNSCGCNRSINYCRRRF